LGFQYSDQELGIVASYWYKAWGRF